MITGAERALRYSTLGERVDAHEPVITQLMTDALARPNLLSLAAGFTDNEALPGELVAASVQRLAHAAPTNAHLQYGMNQGRLELRQQITHLLRGYPGEEALELAPEQVLVANGSQQALYLSAQLLCDPGDIVLVEAPTYFVFLELLRGLGLRPYSLPLTPARRIDFEALQQQFNEWEQGGDLARLKLLYFMGVYANPSARCWSEEDKRKLGSFLQAQSITVPVIEDMAYRELYFESPWPARSILSLPEWEGFPALYAGTFTKPFATGLKVGFVAGHQGDWIRNLARIKGHHDFGTAHFNQAVIEDVIREGLYAAHLASVRSHYHAKMRWLDEALRAEELPDLGWKWEVPTGGLLMWLEAPENFDTATDSAFCKACLDHDVLYVPGELCFAESRPRNAVRLSFGVLGEADLREAVRRFAAAARECSLSV